MKEQQKIVVTYNVNTYQPNFVAFCIKCIALLSNRKVRKATNFNAWMMFPSGFLMAIPSNLGKFYAINS